MPKMLIPQGDRYVPCGWYKTPDGYEILIAEQTALAYVRHTGPESWTVTRVVLPAGQSLEDQTFPTDYRAREAVECKLGVMHLI